MKNDFFISAVHYDDHNITKLNLYANDAYISNICFNSYLLYSSPLNINHCPASKFH
jgi:hypothetical protein